jgi:hypothetical protein
MPCVTKALAMDGVHGGMAAAVKLRLEKITIHLDKGVLNGCENSPDSTTLTGDKNILNSASL